MGIKKLNKFLTETKNAVIIHNNINEYIRNKKQDGYKLFNTKKEPYIIGIDANLYMYKFLYSHEDHLYGFLNQIIKLLLHKIIPVYIFDGIPPYEKNSIIKYRYEKKQKIKNKINILHQQINSNQEHIDVNIENEINRLNKQLIQIKSTDITELKQLLDILHISYIDAVGEADVMCAKLYKKKYINACLSEDMDILIFGCENLIKMHKDTIYEYDINHILNILDINFDQFMNMCLLFGCDYIKPIIKKTSIELYNIVKKHITIENIINNINIDNKTNYSLDNYYNAKNIFIKQEDKEIISKNFSSNILNEIDITVLLEFMNKYSTLKIKHFNNMKIKSNLLYLNKLINNKYFNNFQYNTFIPLRNKIKNSSDTKL